MEEDKYTKDEHFVPVFYLQNFTNATGQVWVLDRKTGKHFTQAPKNICFEKDLYETPAENMHPALGSYILRNQIENNLCECEGTWSALVKKLLGICRLSVNTDALICNGEEKRMLAQFVSNLILRSPRIMKNARLDDICIEKETEEAQIIDYLFMLLGFGKADSFLRFCNKFNHFNSEYGTQKLAADELMKLDLVFYVSDRNDFITSCFPVFYGSRDGSDNLTDVLLPLSPDVLLYYGKKEIVKNQRNRSRSNSLFPLLLKMLLTNLYSPEEDRFFIAREKKDLSDLGKPMSFPDFNKKMLDLKKEK